MSYRLAVLGDLPFAYWRLEETAGTTVADLSGFGFNGTLTGTPRLNVGGLTAGGRAAMFDTNVRFAATVPNIFMRGTENTPVALECWVKPQAPPTARRLIMGRASAGIWLTPRGVEFIVESTQGDKATAFYTITDWNETLHVVSNYVGHNLGIYVNADEGTNDDFEGEFLNESTMFYVGGYSTSSSTVVTLDEVAVYRSTLDIRTITRHYDEAMVALSPLDISQTVGGVYYALDDSSADVAFRFVEDTGEDFALGTTDLRISDDYIHADVGGTHTSDIQYIGGLGDIAGSRIDWDASTPVTVDVSLNRGASWTPCTNHAEIPGVSAGTNLTNKFIQFRKNFPGGPAAPVDGGFSQTFETVFSNEADGETEIVSSTEYTLLFDRLEAVIYKSKISQANLASSAVGIYGNPVLAETASSPLKGRSDMGVTFNRSSYMTVPPIEGGVKAVEFWVKRNADHGGQTAWEYMFDGRAVQGTGPYLALTPANTIGAGGYSAFYVNGAAVAPTIAHFPLGVWVHVISVFSAPVTTTIFLNNMFLQNEAGMSSFAHLVLHSQSLTARQASVLYNTAMGSVNYTALNPAAVTVREKASGIKAYSYAWSAVQNGIA